MTHHPYKNQHGNYDVPPDETTFIVHGAVKSSESLKEYFKKRSSQKRAIVKKVDNSDELIKDFLNKKGQK